MVKLMLVVMLTVPSMLSSGGYAVAEQVQVDNTLLFARVGEQDITREQFEQALSLSMRKRFYHGKPPEDQAEQLRQQVVEEIITRTMLLQEALRIGLRPDHDAIEETLSAYDRRYAGNPRWSAQRESMLSSLRVRLEEEDLLRQLEQRIRRVESPVEREIHAWYEKHPEKFTEPARQQVSLILLRIDPSSPGEAWQAAMDEAGQIVSRLREGGDFAELARLRSADRSAANGGDMGYLHHGMLSSPAQKAVDALPIGAISDPVRLLEGVAIFRVSDRRPAALRPWSDVQERARELWLRERGELAWQDFRRKLKSVTQVSIYAEDDHS